jgi:hypothetical protein
VTQAIGTTDMTRYRGIRYGFRPKSYWIDSDPLAAILRNVSGENRRQMITDYWNAGKLDELDPALLQDKADQGTVSRLGRIHPSFLGGEFLPPYLPGETEIARICLQSTTSDIISLRARPIPTGIAYRIEDEYRGVFRLPIVTSEEPLTLAEMIQQFDEGHLEGLELHGTLALGYNQMNLEHSEPDQLRHFTRIGSPLYRQLEVHFEHVFDDWCAQARAERAADAAAEDGAA